MKNFKTVPNHTSKLRFPGETINYPDLLTNFLENGGLVGDSQFRLTPKTDKVSQITTSVVVDSYHVSKHGQVSTLENGFVDIQKQKSTDNIIPFFVTNLLDNNIDNSPFFTVNRGLKKSTLFNHNDSELEQYQPIHAVVSSNLGNHVESVADTVISRTIVEVSKNPETQLDETKVKDNLKVIFADTLQNHSELDLLDIYGIVDKALRDSYDYLSKFRFDPEYSQKLETAFGTDFNREVADKLFNNFADRNFTNIPTIKIVNRADIYGGNGAFSADTGLVYLSVEFLTDNYNNSSKITDVLLEETGHFVDAQINEIDSPGDEGDIFSELVLGNTLTNEELQALKTENDIITVIRNGQEITTIRNNGSITLENNNTNVLRVATWNIYGGNGNGSSPSSFEDRLKAISQLGSSHDIDVIVLQEVLTIKLDNQTELNKLITIINNATSNKYDIKYVAKEYSQTDSQQWYSATTTGYLVLYNKNTIIPSNIDFYKPADDKWKSGYKLTNNNADVYYRPPIKLDITKNGQNYTLFTWHNEAGSKNKSVWTLPQGVTAASNPSIAALTSFNDLVTNDASINKNSMVLLGDLNVSSKQLAQQSLFTNNTLDAFNMNKKGQANDFIFAGLSQNIQPYNIPYTLKSDAHYPVFADIFPDSPNIDNTSGKKRNADEFNTGKTQIKKGKYFNQSSSTTTTTSSSLADSTNTQIISWEKQLLYLGDNNDNVFNPLIIVDGGKVEVSKDANGKEWIYVKKDASGNNPKIYAAQGNNGDSPLFVGEMKLDPDKLAATITDLGTDSDPDYTIGGFEVKLIDLAFVDDHLEMQGSVTLPKELGGLEVAVKVDSQTGSNNKILLGIPGSEIIPSGQTTSITLGDYGVTVTGGSLKLPGTRKFNALGLIEIQTKDAALDFNFQESEATITGKFTIPSLKNATFDLQGGNYIKVKKVNDALQFAMAADFSVSDINIYGDWKLTNINVKVNKTYDNLSNKVEGTAKLYTSSNNYLDLGLAFENGRLKQIRATSLAGTDFTFFGTEVDLRTITFTPDRNLTDTILWDPELKTQGKLILPEALGKATVDITGLNYLVVNEYGIDLTGGIVKIPNFDKNLLGLENLRAIGTDITLEYAKVLDKDGKTVLEKYFKIQGQLVLPKFYNLTANFSGSNYIKISNNSVNPVEVVGTFSASNIVIATGWTIKSAELGINTTNKRVTAKGTLIIPSNIEIGADVIFDNGVLTYADIKADRLNKPIGSTGAFLQSIEGKYQGGNTSAFTGTVGITAGAEINLNLPSWAGGNKRGSLVDLNASATITSSNLTTDGDITVLGGLMTGKGLAEVNWGKGYLWASSEFNILGKFITTKTQFLTTSNLNLYMFGEANVNIPSFVPFIGGTNLGSGEVYVEYTNDNNLSNDYVAAWGTAFRGTLWESTIGIKVSFDGNWQVIHSQEARTIGQYATTKIKTLHDSLDAPADKEPQHQIGDTIRDTPIISGKNIASTDGNDILHGENTPDTISGKKGNDLLFGEDGNDTLSGDDCEDMLYGGTGNDYLYGNSDNDLLLGDDGDDVLDGGTGNDHLYGGAGNDILNGSAGYDILSGGAGNDQIFGDVTAPIFTYNGKFYFLSNAGSWTQAQAQAVSLGGNLVTVNDAAENQFLVNTFGGSEDLWIGLTDQVTEGTFKWANGEAVTYTNWAPGEPNNVGNEDYAELYAGVGKWNDRPDFGKLQRGIVEIGSNAPIFNYNGKSYFLSNAGSWTQAQAQAVSLGGNLVTVNDAAENQFLVNTFGGSENLWIGLTDQVTEGTFKWANGEAVTYTNWAPGEPNNAGNEDYAEFNFGGVGKWNDRPDFGKLQRGIVEIGSNAPIFNYNGKSYFLSNAGSWTQAQAQAVSLGGNLVTVNDAAENQFLVNTFGGSENLWIGLTDQVTEGTFKWANGEAVTYTNWAPGEPNNAGNEDYAEFNFGGVGKWNDRPDFGKLQRGIVEIGSNAPIFNYNGKSYFLSNAGSWTQAQAQAVSLGGNLVTVNDAAENQFLVNTFGGSENLWIGLTDQVTEGTFKWANGEAVTYTNWAPGEPNNAGNEDYAEFNFGGVGKWNDRPDFGKLQRGIVEIGSNAPIFNYNGKSYFLSNAGSWTQAQAQAVSLGGNLVTVNDAAENQFLVNTFGGSEGLWIGLTDQVTEGTFKWANGEAVTYTNWAPGEPNNAGNEDYAEFNFGGVGKWNDRPDFGKLQRGIVEIGSNAFNYNSDTLNGGAGKDTLTGGLGADRFDYRNLADSVFNSFDVITDFNATAGNDLFVVSTARSVFNNAGSVATLDTTQIAAKLTTATFAANSAAQFSLGSRTFVAINDATAGFSATTDAIIEVTGLTGTLGLYNFTTTLA